MTNRKPLVHPIVHLNGTSAEVLQIERLEAIHALRHAQSKLADMAPNGRDYYLQPGLEAQALAQHDERIAVVSNLIRDLLDEVVKLQEAV